MAGFIKLYRSWSDNPAFRRADPYCQRAAWIWLIEKAAWKDCNRRDPHGNVINVRRGQLHTSTRTLGEAWGWSKNKAERFLRDLQKCQMVDRATDRHGVLITICNYEKYQGERTTDGPQNGTGADQGRTTQEEGKEREEEKKGAYAFAGRVVRLNQRDLDTWQSAFHAIPDLKAELTSLDGWLADEPEARRKKWFNIVSGALNKKHQQLAAPVKASELQVSWP